MKNLKKILAVMLAVVMVLALTACSDNTSQKGDKDDKNESTGDTYTVGICQLVQHPALDAATKGFRDALEEELGDSVKFEEKNASGEIPNCATIVNEFVSSKVDLIMANATPALQAAASATSEIPILGTSVTDYATALEIDDFDGTVGGNISGTSDLAPLEEQADMIKELFPEAKTVGLLYCSAEVNSQYQVEVITGYLEDKGYECERFSFTDSNDISAVTQTACDKVDVIYAPTDNLVASNTEAIANIVLPAGVPVINGEKGPCAVCGVAALSIDYYEIGVETGKMAAKILKGEADISEMPIAFAPNVTKMYNVENCELLNVDVPSDYVPIEDEE